MVMALSHDSVWIWNLFIYYWHFGSIHQKATFTNQCKSLTKHTFKSISHISHIKSTGLYILLLIEWHVRFFHHYSHASDTTTTSRYRTNSLVFSLYCHYIRAVTILMIYGFYWKIAVTTSFLKIGLQLCYTLGHFLVA